MKPHRLLVLLIVIALLVVPASVAKADAGPSFKPEMSFSFRSDAPLSPIISTQLLLCNDSQCQTYRTFEYL